MARLDRVEEFFATMEGQFGKLIPYLGHPVFSLDGTQREVVAQLIAALYLRGPRARQIRNFAVRKEPEAFLCKLRSWFSEYPEPQRSEIAPIQEIEQTLQAGDSFDSFMLSQNVQLINMLQEIPDLERIILSTNWAYCIAPEDNPFITTEILILIYLPGQPNPIVSIEDLKHPDRGAL